MIEQQYHTVIRRKEEVFKQYKSRKKNPSWSDIAGAVEKLDQITLAKKLRDTFATSNVDFVESGTKTISNADIPSPTQCSSSSERLDSPYSLVIPPHQQKVLL